MKKIFTLLIFLFATAFHSIAQDTITGVVNRVAAPYFEQNVCDTRFAITSEGVNYYVMVDNYWPNPYLEDLVIHYDTIAIGNEIEVIGDIKEMEDGNGEAFTVIDIQELINANYNYGTGYVDWTIGIASIQCNIAPDYACYLAINGVLQTNFPIIFNGMTLNSGAYTMVGIADYWPDYDHPILELTQVIPYAIEATANGVIVANDELCLFTPCGDTKYLSFSENNETYYLTNKDKLHNEDFFSPMWGDNVNSNIQGFGSTHYDLFGAPFNTFETLSMETTGERNIQGQMVAVTTPSTGVPVSLGIAIHQNGYHYYIENIEFYEYGSNCVFNGDTIQMNTDVTATFSAASLFLGSWLTPYVFIHVDEIIVNINAIDDVDVIDLKIYPIPSHGIFEISSKQLINNISVCDYSGRVLYNKTCNSNQAFLDLQDYKGLAIIQIIFENGQALSRKIVVH